jgi:hypothetical protein
MLTVLFGLGLQGTNPQAPSQAPGLDGQDPGRPTPS